MSDPRTAIRTTVRLFGPEAQRAGVASVGIELPEGARVPDVIDAIERARPALAGRIAHCRLAVNHAFASHDTEVRPGDELALIGLVSGG